MTKTAQRAELARSAAQAGAEHAAEEFRTLISIESEANKTGLVTAADRKAQRTVVEHIQATFADDPIVAEEADARMSVPESGPAWIIDPIDGTANYVR